MWRISYYRGNLDKASRWVVSVRQESRTEGYNGRNENSGIVSIQQHGPEDVAVGHLGDHSYPFKPHFLEACLTCGGG